MQVTHAYSGPRLPRAQLVYLRHPGIEIRAIDGVPVANADFGDDTDILALVPGTHDLAIRLRVVEVQGRLVRTATSSKPVHVAFQGYAGATLMMSIPREVAPSDRFRDLSGGIKPQVVDLGEAIVRVD